MLKRNLAWGAICFVLVFCVGGFCWALFGQHEVVLTQQELQQKIDAKMPHTTNNGVTVSNVVLDLSGGKVGLAMDASANKLGRELSAHATTTGTLTYDAAHGSFYFVPDAVQISQLRLNGDRVSERVGRFIDRWVDSPKINENRDEVSQMAHNAVDRVVQSAAAAALARVPVYTMPDNMKGQVVRMLVTSIDVHDGKVVAQLSFWQLTKTMFLYVIAFAVAVALAVAMMLNPEWGVVILASTFID